MRSFHFGRRAVRPSPYLQLLLLLALFLRLYRLDSQPLWWDEGYTVYFVSLDFATMLARTAVDIHPPLYYALLQLWSGFVGLGSYSLRMFSVLVGTVSIALIYVLARRLVPSRIALAATALLSVSPFHIFYSQELRMYGLLVLFTLVSLYSLVRILYSEARSLPRWLWPALVLSTAAVLYTEYTGAFLLITEGLIVLWELARGSAGSRKGQRPGLVWLFIGAGVSVLYAPWLIYTGARLQTYVSNKGIIEQYEPLGPSSYFPDHLAAFLAGHLPIGSPMWTAVLFIGLAVGGLAGYGFWRAYQTHRAWLLASIRVLLITLGVLLFSGFLLNLLFPFHPPRYERLLLLAAPVFYIALAFGLAHTGSLSRGALGNATLLTLLIVTILGLVQYYTVPRYVDEDYRALIGQIREHATGEDAIIAIYPWQIGYLRAYWPDMSAWVIEAPVDMWSTDRARRDLDLSTIRLAHRGTWLLAYQEQGRRLEDEIAASFLANDYLVEDETYGHTRLEYWSRATGSIPLAGPFTVGDLGVLNQAGVAAFGAPGGHSPLLLYLDWQLRASGLAYSLRLLDSQGQRVAQADAAIYTDPPVQRRGLFLPNPLLPGDYRVELIIYRQADGQVLPLAGKTPGITLGSLHISP